MSALGNAGGYPAVKFKNVGDKVAGRIVSFEDFQETEYEDDPRRGVKKGDLKFYPKSQDPIMGVRIVLETIPGDETSRVTLYCQGKRLMSAVANAFRAKGAGDLEVGADLAVVHPGYDGRAKAYSADYSRPVAEDEVPF